MLNKTFIILMLSVCSFHLSAQHKAFSDSSALKLTTSVTGDFIANLKGGIQTGHTYIGMENVMLEIDMEKLGLWKGGALFFHGLNTHGNLPSAEIIGDMQVLSNIESGDYTGFYEYYFKQSFGDFNFIIGQHDLNSEFVGTEYGGTFINSSFGIAPSISLNVPVSIYPVAAPALILMYETKKLNFKTGIYDGDPGDFETNRYNLQWNINNDDGYFGIAEIETCPKLFNNNGCYKIGGFYHSGNFTDYRDTTKNMDGNLGFYFISDQTFWVSKENESRYMGGFFQLGYSPSNFNFNDFYLGGGLHLNGILPKRFDDVLGVAFAYANVSSKYRQLYTNYEQGELTFEFTYKISVFDHYTIQPNLQYIVNPGADASLDNALVALIRFNIYLE